MLQVLKNYSRFVFAGSRSCQLSVFAAHDTVKALPYAATVAVGDAKGVDEAVSAAYPAATVHRVESPSAGKFAFAKRTQALIQAQPYPSVTLLCAFPSGPCPYVVQVSRRFAGGGSGTWGAVALALHRGLAVLVFVPDFSGTALLGKLHSRFTSAERTAGGTWFFAPATPTPTTLF
jgi:hypothetical protein